MFSPASSVTMITMDKTLLCTEKGSLLMLRYSPGHACTFYDGHEDGLCDVSISM
jgi:hypothetical protein